MVVQMESHLGRNRLSHLETGVSLLLDAACRTASSVRGRLQIAITFRCFIIAAKKSESHSPSRAVSVTVGSM